MPTEDPLKVSSPPTLSPSIRSSSPNSNVKKCSVKLVDIHSGGGGGPGAGGAGASSGCAPAVTGPHAPVMAAASAAAAGQKRDVSKMNNALDDDAASPAAKKAREVKADPLSNLVSGKPCPPPKAASTVAKESSWLADKSKETSVSNLESIVPPGGKVTISPARLKEKGGGGAAPPSSAGAAPPASDKPQSLPGAVTITKLSTGTSQQVESKDLKNLLGATDGKISAGSNGIRVPPTPSPNTDAGAGAKKSSNSYSVQKQKKLQQQQQLHNHHLHQPQQQHDPPGGGGGSDISCGKCKQAFSTKEAMRLHTCNSILDSQYLTDSADRHRMMVGGGSHSATSSSAADSKSSSPGSGSSLSRSSSRSNSPLLNSHSAATANKPQQPPQDQQSHPSISQLHKSVAAEGKIASGGQSSDAVPCKLIKDERENKLMIEGRPKLSVSKVGGSRGADSGWSKQKKVEGGDTRPATAASSSGAPHPPGGGGNGVKRKTNEGSSVAPPPGAPGASSGSKDWPKIRIKVGGMSIAAGGGPSGGGESSSSGSGPAAKAVGGGKPAMGHPGVRKAEEEGPFSFTFNGKPTYSPSRVEPSQPNQGKGKSRTDEYCLSPMKEEGAEQIMLIQFAESPKDASNKDSPASQSSVADSGVFSIQSNSPSKGDGTTSGTSPDSPNARFPDQQAFGNRDGNGQCKSCHLQLGSSLRLTSHNRMHECIHSF